jgi:hypothetical protein
VYLYVTLSELDGSTISISPPGHISRWLVSCSTWADIFDAELPIEGDGDGAEGVLGHGFAGFSAANWQLSVIGEV